MTTVSFSVHIKLPLSYGINIVTSSTTAGLNETAEAIRNVLAEDGAETSTPKLTDCH